MKKIILLVQSHEDAAALPAAGKVIGRLGCSAVWVLLSPALTVTEDNLKAAVAAIDKDISDLKRGEEGAIRVRDYKTAEDYKARIDTLLTNRNTEVRNAWKRVDEKARKAEGAKHSQAFLQAANPENTPKPGWRVSLSAEHHPHDNWLTFLNEHSGKSTWHEGMKPGEFSVMWPRQLAELQPVEVPSRPVAPTITAAQKEEYNKAVQQVKKVPVPTIKSTSTSRRSELESLRHFALTSIAKKLNVAHEKRPKAEIINDILAAEEVASM